MMYTETGAMPTSPIGRTGSSTIIGGIQLPATALELPGLMDQTTNYMETSSDSNTSTGIAFGFAFSYDRIEQRQISREKCQEHEAP